MEHYKPIIQWEFPSSDGKKIYTTWIYEYFNNCSCRWFEMRKKCKHLKELEKKLLLNKKNI